MLSAALFPHEYPVFGRFRTPRSAIADILLNYSAPIYDTNVYGWLSMRTIRPRKTIGLQWTETLNKDKDFYQYFSFTDSLLDDSYFKYLD